MKLFKKNKGAIIMEFVVVLPLFLIVISVINDVSAIARVKSSLDELSSSIVNVPFLLQPKDEIVTAKKMQNILRSACRAFIVSYKLYVDSYRIPKIVFCWSAVSRSGVLWKMWLQDTDGSLAFSESAISKNEGFGDYTSVITPEEYSGAIGSGVGKILVFEVFLKIGHDIQFINFFKLFNAQNIHIRTFAVPKSQGQLPDLLETNINPAPEDGSGSTELPDGEIVAIMDTSNTRNVLINAMLGMDKIKPNLLENALI